MRFFAQLACMAFAISVSAVPITPSAPALQRRAEQFRLQGLQEVRVDFPPHIHYPQTNIPLQHEIAEKLTLPITPSEDTPPLPFFTRLSTKLHTYFHDCAEEHDHEDHDDGISGDIAPGSLEAPQMLPRPTALTEPSTLGRIVTFWRKADDERNFAYEGKELELRRPTGMRHWGAADKWRLF